MLSKAKQAEILHKEYHHISKFITNPETVSILISELRLNKSKMSSWSQFIRLSPTSNLSNLFSPTIATIINNISNLIGSSPSSVSVSYNKKYNTDNDYLLEIKHKSSYVAMLTIGADKLVKFTSDATNHNYQLNMLSNDLIIYSPIVNQLFTHRTPTKKSGSGSGPNFSIIIISDKK